MITTNKRNKHIDRNIIKELKDKVLSTHKSKVYLHNIALLEHI